MADEAKSKKIENQLAMIKKLRALLSERDENTGMIENPGSSNPALGLNLLKKEDEIPCVCYESKENCELECDIKQEIKEELEDVTWEHIRECYFRECFVDMGSRHLEHPLLTKTDYDLEATEHGKCSTPNTSPESESRSSIGNKVPGEKKNTCRKLNSRRRKNMNPRPYRREFFCEDCDFQCIKLSVMIDHTNQKHGRKLHVCKDCGFQTNLSGDFKRHLMRHTGEMPFSCKVCGKQFRRRSELISRHMLVHRAGGKPFSCELCDYKGSRKEHLRGHIARIHDGKKPYACEKCGRKFSQPYELKRHVNSHSEYRNRLDRLYRCYTCEFETRHRNGIREHLRRHAGEKPYTCSRCDYKASAGRDVVRHVKKYCVHARENSPHARNIEFRVTS